MIKFLTSIYAAFFMYVAAIGILISPAFAFKYHDVDPAFKPYVDNFYKLVKDGCPEKVKYEVNFYTIDFADSPDPEDWVGICEQRVNGYTIHIDKKSWKRLSGDLKLELMYHELSHCIIYRDHVEDDTNYMYPSLRDLPAPIIINQTKANIKAYCND